MQPFGVALFAFSSFFVALLIFLSDSQLLSLLVSSVSTESRPTNDYCKSEYASVDEIVCAGPQRTQSYIWLMTDAWSAIQSGDLASAFPTSRFYHIKSSGYPQVRYI